MYSTYTHIYTCNYIYIEINLGFCMLPHPVRLIKASTVALRRTGSGTRPRPQTTGFRFLRGGSIAGLEILRLQPSLS